ncbi:MAG: manganese efflux pump, partial [Bacteroidaceae bacterium]|nr:manganese efflux pump [Bacteroidaceae bacterium]
MTTLEIWLLGAALAMDCFSVSLASGAILREFLWKTILVMAFCFGLFQALMPCIGWLLTNHFQHWIESFDHWIAFALLLYLGGNMIRSSFSQSEDNTFDPRRLKMILTLSIATSIDALAVGISFVCTGYREWTQLIFPVSV